MVVKLGKCRRRWEEKDGGAEEEGMKVEGEGGRGNSAAGDLLQSGAAVSVRGAAACAEVNFVKLVIVAAAHQHLGDKRGRKRKGGVDKRRQGERADVVRRRGVWQGGCLYGRIAVRQDGKERLVWQRVKESAVGRVNRASSLASPPSLQYSLYYRFLHSSFYSHPQTLTQPLSTGEETSDY